MRLISIAMGACLCLAAAGCSSGAGDASTAAKTAELPAGSSAKQAGVVKANGGHMGGMSATLGPGAVQFGSGLKGR